jgi:large subunit ribosomal protein L10
MNREDKQLVIADLKDRLSSASLVLVAKNQGISAAMTLKMRQAVREASGEVIVAKNTLAKLAIAGTDYANLTDFFKESSVILYSANDPVALAKAASGFSKDCEAFKIKAGAMGSNLFTQEMVKALAELPSLDQLRGQIIGLVMAPATKIARTILEPAAQLARLVKAKSEKDS